MNPTTNGPESQKPKPYQDYEAIASKLDNPVSKAVPYLSLPDDPYGMEFGAAIEPTAPEPRLKRISLSDLFTNPSPPPSFVWESYIPRGVVSLFGAHGGTGKSNIALMLAVCVSFGMPLFGVPTKSCKVLFVSLEDSVGIVRHRLESICRAWLIDPVALAEMLLIVDGSEFPELYSAEPRSAGEVTPSYHELKKMVQSENIGLTIIDNSSDAFGGDEIQRRQVRKFIRALGKLAEIENGAVLLLAHVDKGTSRSPKPENSEGYSGSTAWHNSSRSRMFLTRGQDGLLTLEHQKVNFGKKRDPIKLQWLDDGFPQLVEGYEAPASAIAPAGRSDDQNAQELLRLIAEFEGRGDFFCPTATARNNAYSGLQHDPMFLSLKLKKNDTRRILDQCQRAGWLESIEYRGNRKDHHRWTLTATGRQFAGITAPPSPPSPSCHESTEGEHRTEGAPSAPPYVGGLQGGRSTHEGAHEGAPYFADADPAPPIKTHTTTPDEDF